MFDGGAFGEYLRALELTSRGTGRRVIGIIANAKYHHAKLHADWREAHHGRFDLDFLPPDSPNSIRLSGCGSEPGGTACIMFAFPNCLLSQIGAGDENGRGTVQSMVEAELGTRHTLSLMIPKLLWR